MVVLIAQMLAQHGKRPAILTRGYQRQNAAACMIVDADADVRVVGDEPLLMRRILQAHPLPACREIPVIVGRDRYRSGQLARAQFDADVILLDDGFQHLPLQRTCDIVLIDATNPFGGGYLLPAGFLREPLDHLRRAHAFVITRSDEIDDVAGITRELRRFEPSAPIFTAIHGCAGLRVAGTQTPLAPETLREQRVGSVCGIGNPASFRRILTRSGLTVAAACDFPDHHWFTAQDAAQMRDMMTAQSLDALITTEKDEPKLLRMFEMRAMEIYVLIIRLEVHPAAEFEKLLRSNVS